MTTVVTRARTEQIGEKNDVNSLLSAFVSVYCAYNAQDSKTSQQKEILFFVKESLSNDKSLLSHIHT